MGLFQIMGLMQDRAWDTNSQNSLIPSSFTSHEELENFVLLKMDGSDLVLRGEHDTWHLIHRGGIVKNNIY
jgi:hypothetical protein